MGNSIRVRERTYINHHAETPTKKAWSQNNMSSDIQNIWARSSGIQ